jgi:uncharacterized cupin superfamily protein
MRRPNFVHMIEREIVVTSDGGKPVTVKGDDASVVSSVGTLLYRWAASAVRGS